MNKIKVNKIKKVHWLSVKEWKINKRFYGLLAQGATGEQAKEIVDKEFKP